MDEFIEKAETATPAACAKAATSPAGGEERLQLLERNQVDQAIKQIRPMELEWVRSIRDQC